ncbi:MAG: permease-like cell division protein FtsX [Acidobacteriaceae bacterium]
MTKTFGRAIKAGFTNFFRNIWLSLAATSIMAITLLIITTIFLLYTATQLSIGRIKDKVGISAYFNAQTSEKEILDLKAQLEQMPEIKSVEYIPKNVAIDKFREAHKDEPLLLETLDEFKDSENPLPNSFAIKAHNLEDYDNLSAVLKSDRYTPYFDRIRDNKLVIDRLLKAIEVITQIGIALIVIFALVTILVIFNTIRLTIYNRREEVEIMRLVGATNWYIRGPFITEGIMYGLIATILVSLITIAVLPTLSENIQRLLKLPYELSGSFTQKLFLETMVVNLVVSVSFGMLASAIAMRRYLRI